MNSHTLLIETAGKTILGKYLAASSEDIHMPICDTKNSTPGHTPNRNEYFSPLKNYTRMLMTEVIL